MQGYQSEIRRSRVASLHWVYSNSEHDMKYPQRGQSILQCWDSSRLEQTGQNWLGNSGAVWEFAGSELADWGGSSLTAVFPSRVVLRDEGAQALRMRA